MTYRNCFTNDKTGKRSPVVNCSWVKWTTLSSSPTVEKVGPSDNYVRDSTEGPQLLHGYRSHKTACNGRLSVGPPLAPNLNGESFLLTSRHSTSNKERGSILAKQ